ncbi:MAG: hypothetical protein AWU57_2795, partial [Marinobacter sp. T13-3]
MLVVVGRLVLVVFQALGALGGVDLWFKAAGQGVEVSRDRQGVFRVDSDAEYQELAFGFAAGVVPGVLAEFEPAPGFQLPHTAGTPEAFGLGF